MANFDELYEMISNANLITEATRLSKEIHKRDPRLAEYDSLRYGKNLAKLSNEELGELFDGYEGGLPFPVKYDEKKKKELIENDPKHSLKHAIGTEVPVGKRTKHWQRQAFDTYKKETNEESKQKIKDKYKDWNGRDFSNKPGPYNWYGRDLKASEMKDKIRKNIKDIKRRKWSKESVDDLRLKIYESCYYKEITEEERDLLLESMGDLFI